MTDEKVKALREKIMGQLAATSLGTGSDYVQLNWSEGRQVLALQAERDKLAAAQFTTYPDNGQSVSWREMAEEYHSRWKAAEAKLTALVEIVEAARDLVMKPGGLVNRGVGVGLVVVEKADKSDPHYRLCTAFEKLDAQALAHHSAPVDPFGCSQGSEAWPDGTPTSAPVEGVGGIVRQAFFEGVAEGAYPTGHGRDPQSVWLNSRAAQTLAALSLALIQPQGEERS